MYVRCDGWSGQCDNVADLRVVTIGDRVLLLCAHCAYASDRDGCVKVATDIPGRETAALEIYRP
jgi:hypothetical protein